MINLGEAHDYIKLHDNGRTSKSKNVCEALAIFGLRYSNRFNTIVIPSKGLKGLS